MWYLTNREGGYINTHLSIHLVNNLKEATIFKTKTKAMNVYKHLPKYLRNNNEFFVEKNSSKRIKISKKKREAVYAKSNGICKICGNFIPYSKYTVDHIVPLAKGGSNEIGNLQASCDTCNKIKTDILPQDFIFKITEILIYQMQEDYNDVIINQFTDIKKKNKESRIHRFLKLFCIRYGE